MLRLFTTLLVSALAGTPVFAASAESLRSGNNSLYSGYSSLGSSISSAKEGMASSNADLVNLVRASAARGNAAYLSEASGLSGEQLFQKLHELTGRNAKISSYNAAKSYMYSTADHVTVNGVSGIIAAYSQVLVTGAGSDGSNYKEKGDQNKDGIVDSVGINAEHSWPQSFFKQASPMRADLHHLQSTLETPNNRRSNYAYTMVTGSPKYSTSCGSKLGSNGYEPCDADKGNTARAMLYFMTRYYDKSIRQGAFNNDTFWKSKVEMFLQWNRMDPPDQNEKNRNDLVEQFQGNRNPYIDDYTLADKVGAQAFMAH